MSLVESIVNYFRTSKAELEKVSWPSKNDTIRYSALVVGITVITAVFFAALDLGLHKTVESVLARKTTEQTTQEIPLTTSTSTPDTSAAVGTPAIQATTPDGKPAQVEVETLPTTPSPLKK